MSSDIPNPDQKILAYRCGNRCSKCKNVLIENENDVDPAALLGYMGTWCILMIRSLECIRTYYDSGICGDQLFEINVPSKHEK